MHHRVQAIFFDNDGVLVDTERLYFEATRAVLADEGVELTLEEYIRSFLDGGKGAWHLLPPERSSDREVARLRDRRNRRYAGLLESEEIAVPGAEEALAALRGRVPLGMVTSSRRDHLELMHRRTGLTRYFDFIITSDEVRPVKPHPDPYLAAVKRSGAAAADCLVIEDSVRGLTAARAAGVPCWIVPTVLTGRGDFREADRVLDSVTEIPRLVAIEPT